MEAAKAKCKIRKRKTDKTHFTISIVYFLLARLFTEKNQRTGTIQPGIFLERPLYKQ